jgi:uncharacterized protein
MCRRTHCSAVTSSTPDGISGTCLQELSEEELLDERAAIAGLQHVSRIGGTRRCPIDRYSFPAQDTDVREGDKLHLPDGSDFGEVRGIDLGARTVDVRKTGKQAEVHPTAVFAHSVPNSEVLAEAVLRIGQHSTSSTRE